MTTYESLEQTVKDRNISFNTSPLQVKGLYYADNEFTAIALSSRLETTGERCVALAHELGHHYTNPPNLFLASKQEQDKYEYLASLWAAKTLVSPRRLIKAWQAGIRDIWELAEYLDITPEFAEQSIDILREHYGEYVRVGDYYLHLKPIEVYKA